MIDYNKQNPELPKLATLLQMREDDPPLPGLYFYHGLTGQSVRLVAPFEAADVIP